MRMLTARILTGVILFAACLAAVFLLPNRWWAVLTLAVFLGAAWEWGALAGYGRAGQWGYCAFIFISGLALYLASEAVTLGMQGAELEIAAYAIACAFWLLFAPAWLARRWHTRPPSRAAVAGWIVLVPAWLAMARLQADPLQLLLLLGIVWLADTAAFAVGRSWGRRKLAPAISPGKTWEGVAGAVAAVAVYYVVLSNFTSAGSWAAGWSGAMLFAGVVAASIIGDLFESWVKRQAGVKDSGALLPGHGGILDRIDGLTASMPLAALLMRCLA